MNNELTYHCGDCDRLAPPTKLGRCGRCGSGSVIPATWYRLSPKERAAWLRRIRGDGATGVVPRLAAVPTHTAEAPVPSTWERAVGWLVENIPVRREPRRVERRPPRRAHSSIVGGELAAPTN